jgi:SAM-dependent methyltransferase
MGTNDEMTRENTDLATYYQQRAPHYDEVYAKAERQADLRHLKAVLLALFTGRDVLEVAAGTGYWTSIIATTATTVTATDYNSGPLAIALSRGYPRRNVRLQQADAFALDQLRNTFTASFVGFWWSHIPHLDTDRFLRGLCTRLRPHSPVAIVDNRYVEGSSHPITHTDAGGNTYQDRTLADGSRSPGPEKLPDGCTAANRSRALRHPNRGARTELLLAADLHHQGRPRPVHLNGKRACAARSNRLRA